MVMFEPAGRSHRADPKVRGGIEKCLRGLEQRAARLVQMAEAIHADEAAIKFRKLADATSQENAAVRRWMMTGKPYDYEVSRGASGAVASLMREILEYLPYAR